MDQVITSRMNTSQPTMTNGLNTGLINNTVTPSITVTEYWVSHRTILSSSIYWILPGGLPVKYFKSMNKPGDRRRSTNRNFHTVSMYQWIPSMVGSMVSNECLPTGGQLMNTVIRSSISSHRNVNTGMIPTQHCSVVSSNNRHHPCHQGSNRMNGPRGRRSTTMGMVECQWTGRTECHQMFHQNVIGHRQSNIGSRMGYRIGLYQNEAFPIIEWQWMNRTPIE